ncbi:MAG: 3-oxoacyl-ACP reductase [Candidatus Cloacimonetes bacterium 4572_65]|nr:MAG: 3-oxoacyl-ACP reductase [Candidatus Cloacimonetes bacterium 4572_65]
MFNVKDKVVLVTGSARGIGFGIAKLFAENGAKAVILDINQELVDVAVAKLKELGFEACGYVADVTDVKAIEVIFKTINRELGRIDVLINNAGITKDNLIMRMKEAEWDAVLNVNLKGTFNCIQKACRYMMKQRAGVIINISSVIGQMGNAGQANYAASKGGVIALTKSTAKEFASRNIRVNAIAPGFIETEMTATLPEDVINNYAKAIPLGKMGQVDDIGQLCLFLASDGAKYITGQTINVDGGLIM